MFAISRQTLCICLNLFLILPRVCEGPCWHWNVGGGIAERGQWWCESSSTIGSALSWGHLISTFKGDVKLVNLLEENAERNKQFRHPSCMMVTIQSKDRSIPSVLWSMAFRISISHPWKRRRGSWSWWSAMAWVAKPKRFPSRPLQNKCWRTNRNLKMFQEKTSW